MGYEFGRDFDDVPDRAFSGHLGEIRIVGDYSDDLADVASDVPPITAPTDRPAPPSEVEPLSEVPGLDEGEPGVREASSFFTELKRLGRASGMITQQVLTTALCSGSAAPGMVAAFSHWGTDTPSWFRKLGFYSASRVAGGLISGSQAKANLTNEDTVRKALSAMLLSADSAANQTDLATETLHHLAVLLADPVIIGGILTVVTTKERELLALRPADLAGTSDDDWLLEEVIEALEALALLPNNLASALTVAYSQLAER